MTIDTENSQDNPVPEVVADAVAEETSAQPKPESSKFDENFYKKALDGQRQRIDQLTWQLREKERSEVKPVVDDKPVAAPTRESFEFDETKFQAAQTDYLRNEARRIAREELRQAETERATEVKAQTFREREKAFADKTPDYAEKVYNSGTVPISDAMAEEITDSDMGAEIAYYLANNLDVARQLYQLPERQVAREIGRIEARLSVSKTQPAPTPKVSNAPPPVPKVDASADAGISIKPDAPESDSWTSEEWAKRRNKQVSRRKP